MGKSPIEDYLTCVQKSKLATREQIVKVLDRIKRETGGKPVKLPFVAQCFVDARLVSPWQNEKLLKGRYHGFFLGNYKLLQHLASGGMSNIYLAEHVQMHRRVAIKVLPPSLTNNTSYLQRFYIESRAIASLDHKNIVRAYDVACEGKYHYLVLEYVDGIDLRDLVTKEGPLTYERAADYVRQAAEGLQHAHAKGLIHRDIKPANLLLDKEGVIKLLDMGLSRITHEEHSLTRAHNENIIGTVDYLAPEQAVDSHTVDHRADIYGLGGTLYFLLTGHPPFPEGSHTERLMKHQSEEAEPITVTRPDAPPDLIALCNRMMAKQASDRHQTAAEVSQDLSRWLASYQSRSQGGSSFDDTRDVASLYGETGPDIGRESDSFDSESMTIDIPKMMMSAQAQSEQARQIAQAMTKAIQETPGTSGSAGADPLSVPSDSATRRRETEFARREVDLNRRLSDLERRETTLREREALAQARPRGRLTDDEEIERRAALEMRASELEHTEEKLQKLDRYLEQKAGELEQRAIDVEKARSKLNRLEQFLEKKAAELEKRQREVDVSRSKLTGLEQFLEKKAGELEKRTAVVDKTQEKANADKAAIDKRQADIAAREQKLTEREKAVAEREKNAAQASPAKAGLSPSGIGLPSLAFPELDPGESAVRAARGAGGSGVSAMQAAALDQRAKELEAKAKELEARAKEIEARDKGLAEKTQAAASQQAAALELERAAEAKQAELETQYAAVEAARAELAEQERVFDARKSEAAARERELIQQESELAGKRTEVDGQLAEIERQQAMNAEAGKRLESQRSENERLLAELERQRQEVIQKTGDIDGRLQDLERREADWAQRWAELEARKATSAVDDEELRKADAARNALAQDIKVQAELLQRSTKDLERRWLRLEKKEAELAAARAEFESLQRGSASELAKSMAPAVSPAIPPAAPAMPAPLPPAAPAVKPAPVTPVSPVAKAPPAMPLPLPPAMPAGGTNGGAAGAPPAQPSNPNRTIRIAPRHLPALSPLPGAVAQSGVLPAARPIAQTPPTAAVPQQMPPDYSEPLAGLSPLGITGDDVANAFFAAADDTSGFLPTTNTPAGNNEHSTANLGGGRHRSGNEQDRKVRASVEARMGVGSRIDMEEIVRIEQPPLGAPSRAIRDDEATDHFTKEMLGLMGPPEAAAMAPVANAGSNRGQQEGPLAEGSGSFTLDWPFPETRDAEVVTTRRIAFEGQPILFVQREPETNRWRFLDGMRTGPDDLTVLPLGDVVGLDPSVREVAKMGIGWQAWRATDRDPWQKAPRA